jgi:L-amino acid N-acyltransferase YncA
MQVNPEQIVAYPSAEALNVISNLTEQIRAFSDAIRDDEDSFSVLHENITKLESLIFNEPDNSPAMLIAQNELNAEEYTYLNNAYCRWETEIEFRFSEAILAGKETDFKHYLLSDRFDTLIRRELELLTGPPPERILFIGSGPLPISAFYLHHLTGKRIDCLDRDQAAVEVSRRVIDKLGLNDALHVFNGVGENFNIADYDLIVIALLAKPKRRILRNVRKHAAPGCRILCRTSYGLRRLVYEPTPEDVLLGFDITEKQVAEGDQTISTLLLEGTAHSASNIKLHWLDRMDEKITEGILCLMNRVLKRETTIGFPGPLDPTSGSILISQLDADLRAGRRHVLIAEKDGMIVGQVILTPHHLPNCKHLVELSRGIIDPAYRGAGLTLNAFRQIALKCEELNSEVIYLDVRAGTLVAELWKSFGFVPFGRMPDYARVNGQRYHGLYMSQTVAALKQTVEAKAKGRRQQGQHTGELQPIIPPVAPYRKRYVRPLPPLEFADWQLKVYGITTNGASLDQSLVKAARAMAQEILPDPGVYPPHRYGKGFLIIHAGVDADFVEVCWWGMQNELNMRVLTSPPGQTQCLRERANTDGSIGCVWDLAVVWAEREAWTKHVMREEGADFAAYLAATIEGEI